MTIKAEKSNHPEKRRLLRLKLPWRMSIGRAKSSTKLELMFAGSHVRCELNYSKRLTQLRFINVRETLFSGCVTLTSFGWRSPGLFAQFSNFEVFTRRWSSGVKKSGRVFRRFRWELRLSNISKRFKPINIEYLFINSIRSVKQRITSKFYSLLWIRLGMKRVFFTTLHYFLLSQPNRSLAHFKSYFFSIRSLTNSFSKKLLPLRKPKMALSPHLSRIKNKWLMKEVFFLTSVT